MDIVYLPPIPAAYPAVHLYRIASNVGQAQYAKHASLDFIYQVPHVLCVPQDVIHVLILQHAKFVKMIISY